MRILAVADMVSKYLYDYYTPGKLDGFDLILACGDLSRDYLEFLVDASRCPVLYVKGNHDDSLIDNPPGGCICIDDKVYVYKGIRILGMGGSNRYREGGYMFTEDQMRRRISKLRFKLMKSGGIDILVTHAPARHLNDFDSLSHRGFECFNLLLKKYRPSYFVHGHIHKNYGINIPQKTEIDGVTVINAYDYCEFEYIPKQNIQNKNEKKAAF